MTKYEGIERYIFADMYNFFLKYKDMPNTDYYWEQCIGDSKILMFKYKNHPLAREIMSATIFQIEHTVKGTIIDNYTREEWEEKLKVAHKIGW
jgi:hypothetical protein